MQIGERGFLVSNTVENDIVQPMSQNLGIIEKRKHSLIAIKKHQGEMRKEMEFATIHRSFPVFKMAKR